METTEFQIEVEGQSKAHVYRWLPERPARAALQIIHGMAEHGARYARFARALSDGGFAVYCADLPGHGKTAAGEDLGHFADRDGWNIALASIAAVTARIGRELPGKPLFAFGHSLGSFLLQDHVARHGARLSGAVFSGPSGDLGPMRAVGALLMSLEGRLRGHRHKSALAEALTFKAFNKRFAPARTAFDWLSRDPAEVDRYVADPKCGFRCSSALWTEFLRAAGRLGDPAKLAAVPQRLPVLLIAGSDDPACNGEQGPRTLERLYRGAGMADVTVKIYPQGRHELLNDICRKQVTSDVLTWLDQRMSAYGGAPCETRLSES